MMAMKIMMVLVVLAVGSTLAGENLLENPGFVDGKLVITVHSCTDGTVLGSWTYGRAV